MVNDFLKTLPQFLLPKQLLTATAGKIASMTNPRVKNYLITRFIHRYQVNMQEAREENPHNYVCFNDFFIRQLKPECRPLAQAKVLCPVDGIVSEAGMITEGKIIQAKGRYYTVEELLACGAADCQPFHQGYFATFYLSPKDYHRIHMPVDATIRKMIYVPGRLFSVQPATVRIIPALFARNERLVIFCDTPLGLMAMVLVGATIVGSIGVRWHGELPRLTSIEEFTYSAENAPMLRQGEEMGYFKLGSTVIMLLADADPLQWLPKLSAGQAVRFGEALTI